MLRKKYNTDEKKLHEPKGSEAEDYNWGKSKTDAKEWISTAEQIRNMMLADEAPTTQGLYDFKDGKDNGKELPIDRIEGIDRAEVSQKMQTAQRELKHLEEEAAADTKKAKRQRQQKEEFIETIKEAQNALDASKTEPNKKENT